MNTGQTPIRLLREIAAREAAKRIYAEAFDRLAELQQVEMGANRPLHARKAGQAAFVALRAFRAEDKAK